MKFERMMPEAPVAHRLFVAIRPPADVATRIGAVRDALQPKGHVADERLHITMGLLDDMPVLDPTVVACAKYALSLVRAAPVQLYFDRLSRGTKTICMVPSERPPALTDLQRRIRNAFWDAGINFAPHWSFNPHITLLYKPRADASEAIMPISWRADEVVLVHSLIGLTQHIILDRVTLDG